MRPCSRGRFHFGQLVRKLMGGFDCPLYKGAGEERQELFVSIIDKILRAGEGRMLRKLDRLASQVDAMQEDFEALTDEELRKAAATWQVRAGSRSGRTARQFVDALACKTQTEGK